MTNRLTKETSPYLLQHAENPVDWYAWGPEALELAKRKDIPIFLSVGYSACHWCHVMAHESFENVNIASLLNENFVSIKVDREERPDIDDIYQKACMKVTGQGGWPLSVFLMPDQKPFYIGTYYPPLDMHGRPGFGSLVQRMSQAWREERASVVQGATKFMEQLVVEPNTESANTENIIERSSSGLMGIADVTNGGFGHAPKFPNASCLSFLLRHSMLEGNRSGAHALRSLRKMAAGGIFDHVGGGFHRYSTDARWFVPHFEKMMYDNALVPVVYAEAYALTGDEQYKKILDRTINFVLRDMQGDDGRFYSALDADSDDQEGTYYVWTAREIRDLLGDDADMFCLYYDVTQGGNWEGKTILCNNVPLSSIAFRYEISEDKVRQKLDACLDKLLVERQKRTRPGLDDKSLTSWNAMTISALVSAGILTHNKTYTDAALQCAEFIRTKMTSSDDSEALIRSRRGNVSSSIPGYLEDYAWYADALADLFCASGDDALLMRADTMCARIVERFYDSNGGFYMTDESSHEGLIMRPKSVYDLSVPAGGTVAARALWKIGHIVGNESYIKVARATMSARASDAIQNPFAFGSILCTIFADTRGPLEVTLLDGGGDSTISEYLDSRFIPESIAVRIRSQEHLKKLGKYAFFAGKEFASSSQIAYVCKNSVCSAPITTQTSFESALKN